MAGWRAGGRAGGLQWKWCSGAPSRCRCGGAQAAAHAAHCPLPCPAPPPHPAHRPAGYRFYGLNRGEHEGKAGIWYREWAPAAKALALIGEFNAWEPKPEHWAIKNDYGVWQLFLPDNADGTSQIVHRCVCVGVCGCGWGAQGGVGVAA